MRLSILVENALDHLAHVVADAPAGAEPALVPGRQCPPLQFLLILRAEFDSQGRCIGGLVLCRRAAHLRWLIRWFFGWHERRHLTAYWFNRNDLLIGRVVFCRLIDYP